MCLSHSPPVESNLIIFPNSISHFSYHKFTRGKDLSRYSATDLDCILGSAAVKEKRKTAKEDDLEKKRIEEEELSQASEQKDGQETKSHGLVTIRGGNLNDYFAKKMAALKAKNSSETPNSLLLPSSPRPTLTSNGEEDVSMPAKESSKKKKRKLEPEEVAVADEDCEQPESKKSKKKKSKKEKEDLVEDTNLKPVEMEETKAERKARRKREKKLEKENARLQEEEVNECQEVSETKAEKKARKKREKLEEVAQDSADHDERKKSKKKKKDVEDTAPDCDDAEDDDGDSKVKKRTLLKTKSKNDGVDKIKESKLKKSELDGFKGANLLKMAGYGTH